MSTKHNQDAWKEELRQFLQSRVLDHNSIKEDFNYLRQRRFLNPGFLSEILRNVDPKAARYIQQNRWHKRSQRNFFKYICLFGVFLPVENFQSYRDVINTGEGLQTFTYPQQ